MMNILIKMYLIIIFQRSNFCCRVCRILLDDFKKSPNYEMLLTSCNKHLNKQLNKQLNKPIKKNYIKLLTI